MKISSSLKTNRQLFISSKQRSNLMSVNCPACGSSNPDNSEFCDACGCELEVSATIQAPPPPIDPPQTPVYASPTPIPAPDPMPVSTGSQSTYDPSDSSFSSGSSYGSTAVAVASSTARLIAKHASAPISEFNLESNNIIGRFDSDTGPVDVDLENFPGDDSISRNHAEIYHDNGQWSIKDLGSTNGVFIKSESDARFGNRISTPTVLKHGDEIALGKVRFLFQSP
jgi:hypothetical protein